METLLTLVLIPAVNWVVQWSKEKFDVDGEVALVVVSIIVASLYILFQRIAPEAFVTGAREFASQVFAGAVLVYEFLIKKVMKDKSL